MAEKPESDEAEPQKGKPLSKKHQEFINWYLQLWNQTEAYKRVYPKSSDQSARANAARLIANDSISAAIKMRVDERTMGADENLVRLADFARSDLGPWISNDGAVDIEAMKAHNATKFIRKVKRTERSGVNKDGSEWSVVTGEVELYSALEANKFIADLRKTGPTGSEKDPIHIKHIEVIRPSAENEQS